MPLNIILSTPSASSVSCQITTTVFKQRLLTFETAEQLRIKNPTVFANVTHTVSLVS